MSRDQFISWLKGFTAAVEEIPTQGQWETIVSELNKIKDCPDFGSPIGDTGTASTKGLITDGFIQNINTTNYPYTLTTTPSGSTVTYTITNDSKDS